MTKPTVTSADLQARSEHYPNGVDGFDVRGTFATLTRQTTPHGFEWLQYNELLTKLGFTLDKTANYTGSIMRENGKKPETIFIAHLDTVGNPPHQTIEHVLQGDILSSDGATILGADDKAGVTVLLYLIHKGVPGLYIFTYGEESGRIGSRAFAQRYSAKDYKRAIAFDRKGTTSIITRQSGQTSCSDEFAEALIRAFQKQGMTYQKDPTGSYTDTVSFFGEVPECTNISVGYHDQHTPHETQDLAHLERLCHAAGRIDWEALPTHQDTKKRYSGKVATAVGGYVHRGYYGRNPNLYGDYRDMDPFNDGWEGYGTSGKATPVPTPQPQKKEETEDKRPADQERFEEEALAKEAETRKELAELERDEQQETQEAWDELMELNRTNNLDAADVEGFVFAYPEAGSNALHALISANPYAARQYVVKLDTE